MRFSQVLITGGAGFIGSQLVKRLAPISKKIYIIDDLSTGNKNNIPSYDNIIFFHDTLLNRKLLCSIIPEVEHVFHLACRNLILSVKDINKDLEINLFGGQLLLDSIQKYGNHLKRFVYTSTSSVYGDADIIPTPESYYKIGLPYAASKFAMEHYCQVYNQLYQIPTTIVRLSNVFGPGQLISNPYCGVVAKFFDDIKNDRPLRIYGDGSQTRDFTYIDDVINALLMVSSHSKTIGQIYNVGTGIETSIISLAKEIGRIAKKNELSIDFLPKRTIDTVTRRSVDISKIRNDIRWSPKYNLVEGIYKTYLWNLKL